MSLETEIHKKSGVLIKDIPKDGRYRTFKSGNAEWFAIVFEDCGSFGCFRTNELFGWNGGKAWLIPVEPKERPLGRKEFDHERKIVDIGNALMDGGQLMTEENLDRYILALTRVIDFNGRQKQ